MEMYMSEVRDNKCFNLDLKNVQFFSTCTLYRVSHEKLLKLIGNYFEMHSNIKMAQIGFERRHFEVFFVHQFIMINNILIHLFNISLNR